MLQQTDTCLTASFSGQPE